MRELNLYDNDLKELPDEIRQLTNLAKLWLDESDFAEEEQAKIKSWFKEGVVEFF